MTQGTIFDIKHFAIHDGPGIRTTVFLKGCPLDCWWCHNPEGRRPEPELMAPGADNEEAVAVGRVTTTDAVMADIAKDVLFYDESGGGVTFSGGEPLYQPAFLAELLSRCRRQAIHTALDTTGHAAAEVLQRIAPMVDLFLYDLKLMDDDRHRKYVGVSNRRILQNLRWLTEAGCAVRIRLPLIPRINASRDNLDAMGALLRDLGLPEVDLLPYHGIHRQKYRRLGVADRLGDIPPPGGDDVARVRDYFESGGFSVRVGG